MFFHIGNTATHYKFHGLSRIGIQGLYLTLWDYNEFS
jgi:hypothetical protein